MSYRGSLMSYEESMGELWRSLYGLLESAEGRWLSLGGMNIDAWRL